MKKQVLLSSVLVASALCVPGAAHAAKGDPKMTKETMLAQYDTNKNGKIDPDELAQIKSDFLANPKGELKRLDKNNDGKLSDDELAAITGGKPRNDEKPAGGKRKKNPDE